MDVSRAWWSLVATTTVLAGLGDAPARGAAEPRTWRIDDGPGAVGHLAVTPDGRYAVTAVASGFAAKARVRVWDLLSGQVRADLEGPTRPIGALAVSPGGGLVAVGGGQEDGPGGGFVCELATGRLVWRLDGVPGNVLVLGFGATGEELVAAGRYLVDEGGQPAPPEANAKWEAFFVARWEVTTGRRLGWSRLDVEGSQSLAIAPDGKRVAVGGGFGTGQPLSLCDAVDGSVVASVEGAHPSPTWAVGFSADGTRLASGSAEPMGGFGGGPRNIPPEVKVWEVSEHGLREVKRVVVPGHAIGRLVFRPGGRQFAVVGGNLRLWDLETGQCAVDLGLPNGLGEGAADAAFTTDGRSLVVGGSDGFSVWDPDRGVQISAMRTPYVLALGFGSEGNTLVAGLDDGRVVTRDVEGERNRLILRPGEDRIRLLAPRPRSKEMAVAGAGRIDLLDPSMGTLRWVVSPWDHAAESFVQGLAWTPDGRALVECRAGGSLTCWEPRQDAGWPNARRWSRNIGPEQTGALAFAPDGGTVATAGTDGVVRLRDAGTGEERKILLSLTRRMPRNRLREQTLETGETMISVEIVPGEFEDAPVPIRLLAYSPDGRTLAVADGGLGSTANRVRFHDAETGAERTAYTQWYGMDPHSDGFIHALAYAPDGGLLASSSLGSVMLADPATGEVRAVLACEPHEPMRGLAFAPDGRTLAAGGAGAVRVWDVAEALRAGVPEGKGRPVPAP